jgi:stage II sporulation protein D
MQRGMALKKPNMYHSAKNKSIIKKIKSKQKATYKGTLPKKIPPWKRNTAFHKPKTAATWKLPTILLISSLFFIILIIPTLIVIPFGKENGNESRMVEKEQTAQTPQEETEASPFSVAVMRSTSEEVENVPLETYVSRVIASEMPADFELEALKAQALAARTYIVNHKLHTNENDKKESDVTDTVQHQVYKDDKELKRQWGSDYEWKIDKIKKAVQETKGEILTYNSQPITPAFFSTSNGFTENSEDYWENELPYLRSVESHWDKSSPKFLDQKIFTLNQFENAMKVELNKSGSLVMEVTRTKSNRVDELMIDGHKFSGRAVREKLELRSSDFKIKQKNDHLIFTTKGYGHGIGMSQYGANGMAKEGKTYKDIVNHYYKGVEISTVTDTAPALVAK